MHSSVLFILLPLSFFPVIKVDDEYCLAGSDLCSKEDRYNISGDGKFKSDVYNAKNSFTPCKSKNCSCFYSRLEQDLKPFQNGIELKDIDNVRSKGTTYLVHNHRLYRSTDCIFPAR